LENNAIVIFRVNFFGKGDERFYVDVKVDSECEMEERSVQQGVATPVLAEKLKTVQIGALIAGNRSKTCS
jgi:hypothetical protein